MNVSQSLEFSVFLPIEPVLKGKWKWFSTSVEWIGIKMWESYPGYFVEINGHWMLACVILNEDDYKTKHHLLIFQCQSFKAIQDIYFRETSLVHFCWKSKLKDKWRKTFILWHFLSFYFWRLIESIKITFQTEDNKNTKIENDFRHIYAFGRLFEILH